MSDEELYMNLPDGSTIEFGKLESPEEECGVVEVPIRGLIPRGEVTFEMNWEKNLTPLEAQSIHNTIRSLIKDCLEHPWDGTLHIPIVTRDRRVARRWSRVTGCKFSAFNSKPRVYMMRQRHD